MTGAENELGDFLRARRAAISPNDVGLAGGHSGRRVAGLRREEVAVLAGVSVDYFARLEQGRERNPSPQMIDAISRALHLTPDARGHLYRLAGVNPRLTDDIARTQVHPELLVMLDSFPTVAAYVMGPALDVLAVNAVAAALLSPFDSEPSMPRILFAHPQATTVYPQWEMMARATVHALRLNSGQFPGDPSIMAIVDELRTISPQFAALWLEQSVGGLARAHKVFNHPEVGRIELTYQTFDVRDAPGQQLLVGTPAPQSKSEQALMYLTSMYPTRATELSP